MTNPADRIAEMFGSLTETAPGVFTSPVGLTPDELTTMAQSMVDEANGKGAVEALRRDHPTMGVVGGRPLPEADLAKASPAAALAAQLIHSRDPEADLQQLFGQAEALTAPDYPDSYYPERPDHEDFQQMSRIVRMVDAIADQDPTGSQTFLHTGVDANSMVYMAKQRAMRGKEHLTDVGKVESATIIWVDGFTMGYLLAQGRAPTIQQLLDESIDGSHRSGRV